jgi:hypothetical protein
MMSKSCPIRRVTRLAECVDGAQRESFEKPYRDRPIAYASSDHGAVRESEGVRRARIIRRM